MKNNSVLLEKEGYYLIMSIIGIESFCYRQFGVNNENNKSTKLTCTPEELLHAVRAKINNNFEEHSEPGYAPFCRHVCLENNGLTKSFSGTMRITNELLPYIRTGYIARRDNELPVLMRWLDKTDMPQNLIDQNFTNRQFAKYLRVILYSKEQCIKESEATGVPISGIEIEDAEWLIISVIAQDIKDEIPMNPITMMRNALISEGGSGVDINKEKYAESVTYWDQHINIDA